MPAAAGDVELLLGGVGVEALGDDPVSGDPSDRAENPDERELLLGVGDVVEADGVGEAEGGHEAEHVKSEHADEGPVIARFLLGGDGGGCEQGEAAENVRGCEDSLGGEEAVGDHAEEERRNDGGDRADGVGPGDAVGHAVGAHVVAHGDVPRAPDEELEEHHGGEAGADGLGSGMTCGCH